MIGVIASTVPPSTSTPTRSRPTCSAAAHDVGTCADLGRSSFQGTDDRRAGQLHDGLRATGVEPDFSLVKSKKLVGGGGSR
jgi:hypothetical protein